MGRKISWGNWLAFVVIAAGCGERNHRGQHSFSSNNSKGPASRRLRGLLCDANDFTVSRPRAQGKQKTAIWELGKQLVARIAPRGVRELARPFTWDRCAAETLQVYRMLSADLPQKKAA